MGVKEWVITGVGLVFAAVFWWHGGKLLLMAVRALVRWGRHVLGLGMVAVLLFGLAVGGMGKAQASIWEVRRMCGTRSAGNRVVDEIADAVGWDIGDWGSWRLWSLELCSSFEFDLTEGDGERVFYPSGPATIEFSTVGVATAFWDADNCQTWTYRRQENGRFAVVGKCRVKLYLFPLGSRFNFLVWSRDIYNTFDVGARAFQDFPLHYWIDPANEQALDPFPYS